MKKKVGISLIVLIMCIIIITILSTQTKATTYQDTSTGLTWTYTLSNGNATNVYVSSYSSNSSIENLIIPSSINGYPVTSIGTGNGNIIKNSSSRYNVATIKIPNTVTKINNYAFKYLGYLTEVNIPNSVTSIGNYAFYNCSGYGGRKIQELIIPDSVTSIGEYAFYCAGVSKITMADSVTSIGVHAFDSCKIESITLSNSITTIKNYTFYNCNYLKEIEIPSSVTTIGEYAFGGAGLLTITIPDTVTSVGKNAFRNSSLQSVTLSNNMSTIKDYTFYYCTALKEITIPDSIVEIGNDVFYSCTNLTSIHIGTGVEKIGNETFRGCNKLEQIELPGNVKELGDYLFYGCSALKNVQLNSGLKTIGSYTFSNCTGLTSIILPETVETIKSYAFNNCYGLTGDFTIPDSVTLLGNSAFEGCTGMNGNLVVGKGVTVLNGRTFYSCNFANITLKGNINSIYKDAFDPKVTDIWIDLEKEEVNIKNNEYTGRIHYKNCKHSVSVSVPNGVKVINSVTKQELKTSEFECNSTELSVYLEIDGSVKKEDYKLIIMNDNGDGKDTTEEIIELSEYDGKVYNFGKVLSGKKIAVININSKSNLTLRMFISELNGQELATYRGPKYNYSENGVIYEHTKTPLIVNNNDILTYTIRVYNEGAKDTKATGISMYIPDGLEYIRTDSGNIDKNWQLSDDKTKITTDYLKDTNLEAYNGAGTPNYSEVSVRLKVVATKTLEDIRIVNIAEITSATEEDADSTYGSINTNVDNTYKYDESVNSNSSTYIKGFEDDDDFENVLLSKDVAVSYQLEIQQIDVDTKELLNGAEFELLDENKKLLKSSVTVEDGKLDFGLITKAGEGTDVYYLSETKTPEGYSKITRDDIKIEVIRKIKDRDTGEYEISVKSDIFETQKDPSQITGIPVYTKEQLSKIGTNEEIKIDGVNYRFSQDASYELKNDIDLSGKDWTPISKLTGSFNGNNYKISNMNIHINNKLDVLNIGLFGEVSGEVTNLKLENVNILVENMTKDIEEDDTEAIKERLDTIHVGAIAGIVETGSIRECEVSGTINAESSSVGGIIGYTKGYVLITKCINNANLIGTSSNVGGIIGYANSSISVVNCENNGTISAGEYNAGGMIGYAESGEYAQSNVNIAYVNSKIAINIENKRISDKYVLKLENRDIQSLNLLPDGEFNIYNVEKNAKYSNIKLKDGALKIDDISINELGTDTYYIEQTKTIDSYNKNDNYAKVVVEKTWNGTTEEYEISVKYSVLTEEQFKNEVATDEKYSSSSSGKYFAGYESDSETGKYITMSPTVDYIGLKNNVNKGEVKSNNLNAAGIVGKTYGNIILENCTNEGEITSDRRSSGILGEAIKSDEKGEYVTIQKCSNIGKVTSTYLGPATTVDGVTKWPSESAGILGLSTNDTRVIDCENKGEISGYITGGIVSHTFLDTSIKKCVNTGSVNATDIGSAILASGQGEQNIRIEECSNTGEIVTNHNIGGMIGYAEVNDIDIINCNVNKCNIIDKCLPITEQNINKHPKSAGIAGNIKCNNIYIKNCNVNDTKFDGGDAAGILSYITSFSRVNIEGCKVNNLEITGDANSCAGIVGITKATDVSYGVKSKSQVNILDCDAENISIENGGNSAIYGLSEFVGTIIINNCNANNVNLGNKDIQSCSSGFILGVEYNSENVIIDKCNVENSKIKSERYDYGSGLSFGGIVGASCGHSYDTEDIFKLSNSSIKQCEIDCNESVNVGGAIGFVNTNNVKVSDIIVQSVTINAGKEMAGLIGSEMDYVKNTEISNVNITDCNIKGDGDHKAGCIAFSAGRNNFKMTNVHVKNLSLEGKNEKTAGGLIAMHWGALNMDNCSVTSDENHITHIEAEGLAAGVVPCILEQDRSIINNINNIELNNIDIGSKDIAAGIISTKPYGNDMNITNIKLYNTNITSLGRHGAGISAYLHANNLKLEKIDMKDVNISGMDSAVGCIGNHFDVSSEYYDINLKDITLDSKLCAAGIAGYESSSSNKYENINIDNLKLCNNVENDRFSNSYSAGVLGVTNGNETIMTNVNLSNSKLVSNVGDGIGGIISFAVAGKCNVSNSSVTNTKLEYISDSLSGNQRNIGGIIAVGNSGKIEECKVENVDINVEEKVGSNIGGIVGVSIGFSGNDKIENNKVNDIKIKCDSEEQQKIGGVVGTNQNFEISNNNVNSIEIECESKSGYVGGIVGYTNGNIDNCTIDKGNIDAGNCTGGIVGGIGFTSVEVSNSNVKNVNITNSGDYTGGIAGFAKCTIQGCNVTDSEINSTGDLAYGTGGIVGHGGNEVKGYTYVTGCKISNSNINGYKAVGGIAGAAVPYITECILEGTNVNGYTYVGGELGYGGDRTTTKTEDEYLPITITKSTLTGVKIKGLKESGYVSEIIGRNSHDGIEGEDTVTGTTSTNCEIIDFNSVEETSNTK